MLERHRRYRTAHPALISQILDLLATSARPALPPGGQTSGARNRDLALTEPLTDSETRILRYLPTHLTVHEIANELYLSVNTVSTHKRHLFAKLGVHSRHEAVDRARALGLLAPTHGKLRRRSHETGNAGQLRAVNEAVHPDSMTTRHLPGRESGPVVPARARNLGPE
jgi:DNA-binding CsgD family transcriptional regulator